ncbi:hypothetical protein [Adhaeretor mobilis]|uniref:Uncharacterized protein n=1 Tax=Adhaeretor mobilis TaxID=1930276 RepID=A0A517MS36_9BACT|nr:hypothetical protein [Adhaeretor mobilis]QDS97685.1 hypothetical protein HG15A2_09490 [Adhaeretor mobilis]
MTLIDLWNSDRTQVTSKRLEQLIAFAGEGKLRDGNETTAELRALLAVVPSDILGEWIEECLTSRFSDFGFVVQDIVNEIGHRLNFVVRPGVYRGHSNEGYDGLWQIPNGQSILVESKCSTAYSINLARIADYRKQIAPDLAVEPESISILLVVGDESTEDLEAQVRGSRFAWDIRLLGMRALFRLLQLRESLDDPAVERQIQNLLIPKEFTRLDSIVDLVFSTAEDAQDNTEEPEVEHSEPRTKDTPAANFHGEILPRLERRFGKSLVKRSRVVWGSPDDSVLVSCQVSREYDSGGYWFGLKRTTKESLEKHGNAHCAFGLNSPDKVLLIPYNDLAKQLDNCHTSPDRDGSIRHWHIRLETNEAGEISMLSRGDHAHLPVSEFLLDRT